MNITIAQLEIYSQKSKINLKSRQMRYKQMAIMTSLLPCVKNWVIFFFFSWLKRASKQEKVEIIGIEKIFSLKIYN